MRFKTAGPYYGRRREANEGKYSVRMAPAADLNSAGHRAKMLAPRQEISEKMGKRQAGNAAKLLVAEFHHREKIAKTGAGSEEDSGPVDLLA